MPTAQKTSVRRLTTTEAAVLALLAIEGERSGYELAKAVTKSIGHVWAPARSGLYAALPRLAKLGLARARRVAQESRPDKDVYAIAPAGRAALEQWLETVEPGARETFLLKLFLGGLTRVEVLLEHLAQFRADTEEQLDVYREIERVNSNSGHDWFHRHLLLYGIQRAEHDLAWADGVARSLRGRRR
jgi:DNA-binding PadR family transcriptional regulator